MRRSLTTDLFAIAVVIAALCTACGGDDQPTGGSAAVNPTHAWALDGDGDPVSGEVSIAFSGTHELATEAVSFDGATGYAASRPPGPVDTTDSFSVTAWVSLSPPALAGGAEFATAVSQLGDEAAAFYLGVAEGSWAFSMKDADTNEPGHTIRALADDAVPDPGSWVHLVGVHDAQEGLIRLYVNGDPAAETSFTGSWQANGPLTVGRSQASSVASDFWTGAIADVGLYGAALNEDDVRGLADQTRPTGSPPPLPSVALSALEGTYEYTYTPEEAADVIALGFSPEEAAQAGYPGTVSTSLRFQGEQWQQFFTIAGTVFTVNGQPEGDGGTFVIEDDRLITANRGGIEVTYRWSLREDVLALTVLENSAGPEDTAAVRLITEHDFSLVTTG